MGSLKSARVSVRLATVTRHTRELPSLLAPGRSDISKMSSLTAVSDGSERSEGAQDGPTRTLAGVAIARSYPRALTIGPPGVLTRDPAGLFLSEERAGRHPRPGARVAVLAIEDSAAAYTGALATPRAKSQRSVKLPKE